MEADLLELVAERSDELVQLFCHQGVQTCQDVVGIWSHGGELVTELERIQGPLDAEEAFQVSALWTLAARRAHDHHRRVARAVIGNRVSVVETTSMVVAPQGTGPKGHVRQLLETGFPGRPPMLMAAATADPHTKAEAKRATKTQALFDLLLSEFLNLAELGVSWEELSDPVRLQQFKDQIMQSTGRLYTEARIGALLAALRRWQRYASEKAFPVAQPTPLQLGEFFRAVAQGGPTAASSMFQALKWFRVTFGLNFNTDHWLTQPFRLLPPDHRVQQRTELQPWELVNLLLMMKKASGTHLLILTFFVWAAISCVRFEHFQRSHYMESHPQCLVFECSQGKARRRGARPPYSWAMPELEFQGLSIHRIVRDFVTMELNPQLNFLWPALQLSSDDLWEVTEGTAWLVNRKMSRGRFLELLRGALITMQVDHAQARGAGYNRLRRFLPTMGMVCGLQPPNQQAIGNWQEVPSAGGPEPVRKSKAVWSMGLHYAGQKVLHSAAVKRALIQRFLHLLRRKLPELALNADGLVARDAWTWPELAQMNESFGPLEAALMTPEVQPPPEAPPVTAPEAPPPADTLPEEASGSALPVAGPKEEIPAEEADNVTPPVGAADQEARSASSSTTSSSASDCSAMGSDLEGVLAEEAAITEAKWFVQSRRVHIVSGVLDERQLPYCRDSPFAQDPKSQGEGFGLVVRSQFCQRCLARMPRGLYASLADQCGWLH